jgi:hypothetical protein
VMSGLCRDTLLGLIRSRKFLIDNQIGVSEIDQKNAIQWLEMCEKEVIENSVDEKKSNFPERGNVNITDQDIDIFTTCQFDTCTVCNYDRREICREINSEFRKAGKKTVNTLKKGKSSGTNRIRNKS